MEELSSLIANPITPSKRQKGMDTLIAPSRDEVVQAVENARRRFTHADTELKSFRFTYPVSAEQFESWKALTATWDQCDEELQAARENLRDFDHGKLISDN